jgi:gliding motility-associated-like protein
MKYINLLVCIFFLNAFDMSAQRGFSVSDDVFASRYFIENKGQYEPALAFGQKINFAYENGSEKVYFTDKGLVYKLVKRYPVSEEQKEKMERGKKVKFRPDDIYFVQMNWPGCNSDIQIIQDEKSQHYYTYGGPDVNAYGFKKITFKNVYDGIDVEYLMTADKKHGIKYNVILHPGADLSKFKIAYSGDVKKIILENGEVTVKTPLNDIVEHSPFSYYETGETINSGFQLSDDLISFNLSGPNSFSDKKIIIDPWVTTIANFPTNNFAYDVDFDDGGNTFCYGGTEAGANRPQVAKYLPNGALQWVFPGQVISINWVSDGGTGPGWDGIGNFLVHPVNGKTYVCQGAVPAGTRVIRLDPLGNYDNFVSAQSNTWQESWEMGFYCTNNQVYGLGGGTSGPTNGALIDQNTGTVVTGNFTGQLGGGFQDLLSSAIDNIGVLYVAMASNGFQSLNNTLIKVAPGFNGNTWLVPTTFSSFTEGGNKSLYGGGNTMLSNGYNCLAVNNNFLFYYDGFNLAVYSKATGAIQGAMTVPLQLRRQGGIEVDDCNNIYIGGIGNIICYNYNGTFNPLASIPLGNNLNNQHVFDIKMDKCDKTLHVCGNGFVGQYSAIHSIFCATQYVGCNSVAVAMVTATQTGCTNTLNAATVSGQFTSNPIAVTWSPTPQSISGNSLNATGLSPGITTISILFATGCPVTLTVNILPTPPPITFSVLSLTAPSLTCIYPSLSYSAVSSYTYGTLNYFWNSLSYTSNVSSATLTQAGNVTVTATDPNTGCVATKTFAVPSNTIAPTVSVTPPNQAISCAGGAVTFTGTVSSPSINLTQDWYSPQNPPPGGAPIASSTGTTSLLSGTYAPGVYSLVVVDQVNGCKTIKTVTIASLDAWPTYTLASPTNFSLGCNPLQQTTISIINPQSTQIPPGVCSYTFLPPGFSGVITNTMIFGAITSTITQLAGTWTIIVQDNSNFCRTTIPVPVIINTIAPNVSAIYIPTLTCYNPTILATGTSTTPSTTVTWEVPSIPSTLSSATVVIGDPNNGPNTGTTSLTYANYTVIAHNPLNACETKSVINIYQNFKPPISSPTISIATPTAIYCTVADKPVILTTGNSTTTSGGGPTAFVANPCWAGPSPQTPTCGPSTYSCFVPGIYTLTVMDNYNGCLSSGTVVVLDKAQPPVITNSINTAILNCGASQTSLFAATTGTNTGLMYWYFNYPTGAAFSPSAAPIANGSNFYLSGTTSATVNVDMTGTYKYIITNTITGCQSFGIFNVNAGGLNIDFSADPSVGFAPLQVVFTPTNMNDLMGVTNVWSFGQGNSLTSTLNLNPSITYTSPGTYTVMLISQKGMCIDTVYKTIKVEMPSLLEVPNIFTPNGDGSNDVFFLKTSGLSNVKATIFDRWGNKVYETDSGTGNIAWDGKNFSGKECAAGVYFYLIDAAGVDDVKYKRKGNVTLIR